MENIELTKEEERAKLENLIDSGIAENIEMAFMWDNRLSMEICDKYNYLLGVWGLSVSCNNVIELFRHKALDLSDYDMSFSTLNAICNLTNLTNLELRNCNLSVLPSKIGNLANLKHLDLSRNKLTCNSFPNSLVNLKDLRSLILSGNLLKKVPSIIWEITSLKRLDLDRNYLKSVSDKISLLRNLEIVFLCGNYMDRLPEGLKQLNKLHDLFMDNNLMDDDSIMEIQEIPNLFRASFEDNRIKVYPYQIGDFKKSGNRDNYVRRK